MERRGMMRKNRSSVTPRRKRKLSHCQVKERGKS
jgi:hypothetical protein